MSRDHQHIVMSYLNRSSLAVGAHVRSSKSTPSESRNLNGGQFFGQGEAAVYERSCHRRGLFCSDLVPTLCTAELSDLHQVTPQNTSLSHTLKRTLSLKYARNALISSINPDCCRGNHGGQIVVYFRPSIFTAGGVARSVRAKNGGLGKSPSD